MDLGIAGRHALICGGSSGLGFACAQQLAAEGVNITLVSRDENKLRRAAQTLSATSQVNVDWFAADLSQPAARQALVKAFDQIDILITNAGGPPGLPFAELDREKWQTALEQNFLSAFELINALVPGMVERGFGRIVNITSTSVKAPVANLELSTGARMALTGYVSSISRQLAKFNVAINNLLPGPIMTDRVKELGNVAEEMINDVPAQRAGKPQEFAAACAFLCSESASFIIGQNLCVDGGLVKTTL